MNIFQVPPFHLIGLAIRTTNENGLAAADIPGLWARFFSENLLQQIPHRLSDTLYCVYTEYEKDYTRPYTTLLGCAVSSVEAVPEGMRAIRIGGGNYTLFSCRGNIHQGLVYREWEKIWQSNLERAYTADYEVYGPKAADPENAEVEIFIALK